MSYIDANCLSIITQKKQTHFICKKVPTFLTVSIAINAFDFDSTKESQEEFCKKIPLLKIILKILHVYHLGCFQW